MSDQPTQGAESGGRVLLVDDDESVRNALSRVLRRKGHQVTAATSGRHATELLAENAFETVVSDVRMPDMDGIGLLRAVRERDADLPVLLMSGTPDLDTAMQAVALGAFEYLVKPVEVAKLEASVARAVASFRLKRGQRDVLEAHERGRTGEIPVPSAAHGYTNALLGGRYRVGKLIGEGGMGAVYEATREDLAQMRVALRILHPALLSNRNVVARFRREAEMVAALNHPNIVRILDFQSPANEPAFLVMERLYGASLGTTILNEGPLAPERVVFIAYQVLDALGATHRARVIHRDLKPDNVFLTSLTGVGDVVKLLDFGVAKLAEGTGRDKLTRTGMVMGTPSYMAPETARGENVDARSDIYAVGCVIYEALTGRVPFEAENYHRLLHVIQDSVAEPLTKQRPDLDPDLAAVVERAMSKRAEDRYSSAESMVEALSPWIASAIPPSTDSPASIASAPTMMASSVPSPRIPSPGKPDDEP